MTSTGGNPKVDKLGRGFDPHHLHQRNRNVYRIDADCRAL